MAGNFYKAGFVQLSNENKVVIDSNETIKRRLEELKNKMTVMEDNSAEDSLLDEFADGIDPVQVARLVGDDEEENTSLSSEGFSEGLAARPASGNVIRPRSENANIPEEIIAKAEAEADEIRENAKNSGYEEGYTEGLETGHNEGYANGQEEAQSFYENEYRNKSQSLEAEYKNKESALQAEYNQLRDDLEPMLVDKIMDVIKHVTGIELAGNRETIITILRSALENMDNGKNYLIHVSKEDYENVKASKAEIAKGTGLLEDSFEIIEDNSVPANGALIESEAGIFDCGLGTQLELLKKQLLLLSFE